MTSTMSSDRGSTGSVGSLNSGIQAQLSPPNQLPRVADDQLKTLEENFRHNRNPSDLDITLIAAECGLPEPAVKDTLYRRYFIESENIIQKQRWFEHRLARWRQQQGLPANSGSVTE